MCRTIPDQLRKRQKKPPLSSHATTEHRFCPSSVQHYHPASQARKASNNRFNTSNGGKRGPMQERDKQPVCVGRGARSTEKKLSLPPISGGLSMNPLLWSLQTPPRGIFSLSFFP